MFIEKSQQMHEHGRKNAGAFLRRLCQPSYVAYLK